MKKHSVETSTHIQCLIFVDSAASMQSSMAWYPSHVTPTLQNSISWKWLSLRQCSSTYSLIQQS